eukprot:3618629-Amphidinium_carterae.3
MVLQHMRFTTQLRKMCALPAAASANGFGVCKPQVLPIECSLLLHRVPVCASLPCSKSTGRSQTCFKDQLTTTLCFPKDGYEEAALQSFQKRSAGKESWWGESYKQVDTLKLFKSREPTSSRKSSTSAGVHAE